MSIILEGGCRVTQMHEGVAREAGTLRVWPQIGRDAGAQAISLRVLEFAPGLSPGLRSENCDEILYVLGSHWDREPLARYNVSKEQAADHSRIFIDGWPYEVGAATGVYLQPGRTLSVDNSGTE